MNTRTTELFGKSAMEKISSANICVVGIGGVGGFVAEFFARSGVGALTLIDFDIIEKSNINRQIIALNSTLGQNKAEVMQKRISDINPNCKIEIITQKIEENNLKTIFFNKKFDFIVDCIDILTDKLALIKFCNENNLKIISSMGVGNRFSIPSYQVKDIFKTENDALARILRKKLRECNIKCLDVCISATPADVNCQTPSSVVWHPACAGAVISAFVINQIIKK